LFGMLPNCKLYGCVSPDGSSHTWASLNN
jgi:hypothetical protein